MAAYAVVLRPCRRLAVLRGLEHATEFHRISELIKQRIAQFNVVSEAHNKVLLFL